MSYVHRLTDLGILPAEFRDTDHRPSVHGGEGHKLFSFPYRMLKNNNATVNRIVNLHKYAFTTDYHVDGRCSMGNADKLMRTFYDLRSDYLYYGRDARNLLDATHHARSHVVTCLLHRFGTRVLIGRPNFGHEYAIQRLLAMLNELNYAMSDIVGIRTSTEKTYRDFEHLVRDLLYPRLVHPRNATSRNVINLRRVYIATKPRAQRFTHRLPQFPLRAPRPPPPPPAPQRRKQYRRRY